MEMVGEYAVCIIGSEGWMLGLRVIHFCHFREPVLRVLQRNLFFLVVSDNGDSRDVYGQDEGSDTDSSSSSVGEYSAKENNPQSIGAAGSGGRRFRQAYNKSSDEYHKRRERNNLAVRKSRDKAKQKQKESLHRLQELTAENKRLQLKAELLMKELVVLKGLFPTIGETPPPEVDQFLLSE